MKWVLPICLLALVGCSSAPSRGPTPEPKAEWNRVRLQLTLRNAADRIRSQDLGAARHELEGAILNNTADERVHILLARIAIEEGRYQDVEPHLRLAEKHDPNSPSIPVVRGLLAEIQGRWAQASSSYAKAARRFPRNESLMLARMRTLQAAGGSVEADWHISRSLQADTVSPAVLRAAGYRELNAGRARTALAFFDRALARHPGQREAIEGRALALHALGEHAQVVATLRGRIGERDSGRLQLALARSALVTESYDIAIPMFQAHLATQERNVDAWLDLARAFFLTAHTRESRQAAQRALSLRPGFGPAVLLMGHIGFREGRYAEALDAYQQAAQLGTGGPGGLEGLIQAARQRLTSAPGAGAEHVASTTPRRIHR